MAWLLQCWANHPEAIWELSTLRAEWERKCADEGNRDLAGALTWHDKWLPGVLDRLSRPFANAWTSGKPDGPDAIPRRPGLSLA